MPVTALCACQLERRALIRAPAEARMSGPTLMASEVMKRAAPTLVLRPMPRFTCSALLRMLVAVDMQNASSAGISAQKQPVPLSPGNKSLPARTATGLVTFV